MLKSLKIRNLILVDEATITFEKGLNIITGETGAGKSAIICAIALLCGQRADLETIGKHGDLAYIEAEISHFSLPLEITPPKDGQSLIIRREIHKSGKNRIFANDQLISLQQLKQITNPHFEIIEQSSALKILEKSEQKKILSLFAKVEEKVKILEKDFAMQMQCEKRIQELQQLLKNRDQDLDWASQDLQAILDVDWKENEDEQLMQQHKAFAYGQEISASLHQLSELIEKNPLKKGAVILESLSKMDATLLPLSQNFKSVHVELAEIKSQIDTYINHSYIDPLSLEKVEQRMAKIDQIKRRFGRTFAEVELKKKHLEQKIQELSNLDDELHEKSSLLAALREKNISLATDISLNRKNAAQILCPLIEKELQHLNLLNAKFSIEFEKGPLTSDGFDLIEFTFSANSGHDPLPLDKSASGGELSRILFAIKTILIDQDNICCLIFDEIDSNVGGQTASILGQKLLHMGKFRQIICITHFVQVAKMANHHFLVSKKEEAGKTISSITKLCKNLQEKEFQRMLGK